MVAQQSGSRLGEPNGSSLLAEEGKFYQATEKKKKKRRPNYDVAWRGLGEGSRSRRGLEVAGQWLYHVCRYFGEGGEERRKENEKGGR